MVGGLLIGAAKKGNTMKLRYWTCVAGPLLVGGAFGCGGAGLKGDSGSGLGTAPYGGKAHAIPGTIEAEDFDIGKEGTSHRDADPQNQGAPYRTTSVDVEKRSDASGGYGVGWTKAGEWLVYTVNVAEAGTYKVEIPVASAKKGGVFHLEFNGEDKTGPIDVPNTGSWQKLETISKNGIQLDKGQQMMRVVMDSEGETQSVADIDLFRFTRG